MQPSRENPGKWYAVLMDKDALTSKRKRDYRISLNSLMERTSKRAIPLSIKWSLDRLDAILTIQRSDDPHRRKTFQERMEGREIARMVSELIARTTEKDRERKRKDPVREGGPLLLDPSLGSNLLLTKNGGQCMKPMNSTVPAVVLMF